MLTRGTRKGLSLNVKTEYYLFLCVEQDSKDHSERTGGQRLRHEDIKSNGV